jgi:hypothetical protein
VHRTALCLLLLAALAIGEDFEARFVSALLKDLADGTESNTAALVAPSVRALLSPAILKPVYDATRKLGAVRSLEREPGTPYVPGTAVRYLLVQEQGDTLITCVFDQEGLLTGYWFKPAPPRWSLDEIRARMEAWKGDYGFHHVVLDKDGKVLAEECKSRGREVFPLGSIFKVYILAELARQVEEGKLSLERKVTIQEPLKSLPSGVLHTKDAGTEVTVEEMARQMIAISDNTATDHLLHLVGREQVEEHLAEYFNTVPARNTPFLSTREMFLIKGGGKEQAALGFDFKVLCERYPKADVATRREMVTKLSAPFRELSIAAILPMVGLGYQIRSSFQGRHLTFEWFARPGDITALYLAAHRGTLKGAKTFLRFFAAGSEIYPRNRLRYHGFKGGSETNVFALSALATHPNGRTVAICLCRSGELESRPALAALKATTALMRLGLEGETPR